MMDDDDDSDADDSAQFFANLQHGFVRTNTADAETQAYEVRLPPAHCMAGKALVQTWVDCTMCSSRLSVGCTGSCGCCDRGCTRRGRRGGVGIASMKCRCAALSLASRQASAHDGYDDGEAHAVESSFLKYLFYFPGKKVIDETMNRSPACIDSGLSIGGGLRVQELKEDFSRVLPGCSSADS